MTVRPRSVGSFFTSRSSELANARAVSRRSSISTRVRSEMLSRWRRNARGGAPVVSARRMSDIVILQDRGCDEQDGICLVDLEQVHMNALRARRGQVLAD